jgi:hypothetical protein
MSVARQYHSPLVNQVCVALTNRLVAIETELHEARGHLIELEQRVEATREVGFSRGDAMQAG